MPRTVLGPIVFCVTMLCLMAVADGARAESRWLPFAHEVRALSTERPRRPSQHGSVHRPGFAKQTANASALAREKMHHESMRQGPVAPPLIDFINEIDNGLTLPAAAPEASWILRAYNPRLALPDADILPTLNMRQPTPF